MKPSKCFNPNTEGLSESGLIRTWLMSICGRLRSARESRSTRHPVQTQNHRPPSRFRPAQFKQTYQLDYQDHRGPGSDTRDQNWTRISTVKLAWLAWSCLFAPLQQLAWLAQLACVSRPGQNSHHRVFISPGCGRTCPQGEPALLTPSVKRA